MRGDLILIFYMFGVQPFSNPGLDRGSDGVWIGGGKGEGTRVERAMARVGDERWWGSYRMCPMYACTSNRGGRSDPVRGDSGTGLIGQVYSVREVTLKSV